MEQPQHEFCMYQCRVPGYICPPHHAQPARTLFRTSQSHPLNRTSLLQASSLSPKNFNTIGDALKKKVSTTTRETNIANNNGPPLDDWPFVSLSPTGLFLSSDPITHFRFLNKIIQQTHRHNVLPRRVSRWWSWRAWRRLSRRTRRIPAEGHGPAGAGSRYGEFRSFFSL